jgi:hypothetical protein
MNITPAQNTTRFCALLALILAVSGCNTQDIFSKLSSKPELTTSEKALASDLTGFCPQVLLREGTATTTKYEKGADGDATRVIYQGSISQVTRSCARTNGTVKMTIGVSGKVVAGAKASGNPVTLPIRVVIVSGDKVLYSQLHQSTVSVVAGQPATQFILSDPNPVISEAEINSVQIFVGLDEGSQNPKKSLEKQK